jgi:tetratricopeptide (TPR) repeat protein
MMGYQPGIAQALNNLGEVARLSGDDRRARAAYEECLSVCQATGEARRIYYMVNNLAYIAQHDGDYERALELGRQALDMTRARDSQPDIAQALMTLAGPIAALGRPRTAALLLSAAEVACERMGALIQPNDRLENDRVVSAARTRLGAEAFQAAWAEGRQMALEQAVEYALDGDGEA